MPKPSFKRNTPKKIIGKKILIACEGKQTEPKYFNAIRQDLRLTTVQVLILPHDGTDPLSVVNTVLEARKDKKREKTWFDDQDSAWAVFDGDEHIANNRPNWCQAIQIAKSQKINLAITNPSIEFWYLIHFQDHSAIIARDKARERLKQHIPDYDKARCYYQKELKVRTKDAIKNANKLDELAKQNKLPEYSNPCCSGISKLVEMLLKLGDR
ncbi:MAG: RloB domain-containing protein [Pseudanabaena frigida]|uniref:RloB domain-containing protein n=1 Tax=Pseudanabaena frigida TaxID=945775 RepID=A0A2W4VSI3_9CYAN|nr:MAG: RloB domain-containing protein [Pseudanabaena frigida]